MTGVMGDAMRSAAAAGQRSSSNSSSFFFVGGRVMHAFCTLNIRARIEQLARRRQRGVAGINPTYPTD